MLMRSVLASCALSLASSPAPAQPLFSDPFSDAATYRAARGDLADAAYRLRYEVTRSENGGPQETSELIIDVAPDWSLVTEGERVMLRDFALNRTFILSGIPSGDGFTTMNSLADVTFRVLERQNRVYLQGVMAQLQAADENADMQFPDDCDIDAELGLALPGMDGSETSLSEEGGRVALTCAGREIASYVRGDASAPPAAFWPTMFTEMAAHPELHRSIKDGGVPPALLETGFSVAPDAATERSYRLVAVETVVTPYPLTEGLRNGTAEQLDAVVAPGAAQLAVDAVAGRAQGGAPTLESWAEHLEAVSENEGRATAAMLLSPTANMFPEVTGCEGALSSHPYCGLVTEIRDLEDPAPWALLEVAVAEQSRNPAGAIEAMQRAQASPLKDHPVLGATFALAVLTFDQALLDQAIAAGLPTDVAGLQAAAVMAYPYNPAYWTDIGDRYAGGYQLDVAFLLYDVAFSLPMPSAVDNSALASRREGMERIRNDFPDAFLPR